jgi:hypothetical protein
MHPYDLTNHGRFAEAELAYRVLLSEDPQGAGLVGGLTKALMGLCRFDEAIELLKIEHASRKAKLPDDSGAALDIAVCFWRLGRDQDAQRLMVDLCADVLAKRVTMAPDAAGGATFGLVLLYMADTRAGDTVLPIALDYLKKLNKMYGAKPYYYRFPKQIVRQALGIVAFEEVLLDEFGHSGLEDLFRRARRSKLDAAYLRYALFFDGVIRRRRGDQNGFHERMVQAGGIDDFAGGAIWHLIQHELSK